MRHILKLTEAKLENEESLARPEIAELLTARQAEIRNIKSLEKRRKTLPQKSQIGRASCRERV